MNNNRRNKTNRKLKVSRRSPKKAGVKVTYSLPPTRRIAPDQFTTVLRYFDTTAAVINNTLASFASVRFRPTSPFDVDPTLGGTTVPGFTELAALYGRYRVKSSSIRVDFSNLESFPVYVFVFASNFDLGANYSQPGSAESSSFAQRRILSKIGGQDRATISFRPLKTSDVMGSKAPDFADDFAAAVTNSPVNNWYWNVMAWSGTGSILSLGVQALISIDMRVSFYEMKHMIN